MTRIAIAGAAGRMGKALIESTHKHPETSLGAAIVRPGSSLIGVDAGELGNVGKLGVAVSASLAEVIDQFDVLIDFSSPTATLENVKLCVKVL